MNKDIITMSEKELSRYEIVTRLIRKELKQQDVARFLGLSTRQIRRMKKSVEEHGPQGLINGNRGRLSNNRMPDKEREHIVKLLTKHYADFGPTLASEKLEEIHNIARDPKTVRQIMIDEKLWKPRKSKRKEHREWRQRKAFFGELEQFDGSYHAWLEDRLPGKQCLLLSVDDATGVITHAYFDKHEGVFPVFGFWQEYVKKHGKPMAIYLDKFSTYTMSQKVAQENHDTKTQFERAMKQLQIEPITAHSPEAKGRVERVFGVLQDRLVKEMRLKGICTVEEANEYLQNEFIPWYNIRYAVASRGESDLHKKLTQKERVSLPHVLSRHTKRTIQNDFTVSFNKQWYQVLSKQRVTVQKRDELVVEEWLDDSVHFMLRVKELNIQPILKGMQRTKQAIPWVIPATIKSPVR